MIDTIQFFNEGTVNVFTDASVQHHRDGITESVAGALVQYYDSNGQIKYDTRCTRLMPSTNNEGEIYAIYMGIQQCISHMNANPRTKFVYNIFSDSKISISGLREWYKGWIKNGRPKGILMNSLGDPIANQQIFLMCMNSIIISNIKIQFWHVRGHMRVNSEHDIRKFMEDFRRYNSTSERPTIELSQTMMHFNDIIDNLSRDMLTPYEGDEIKIKKEFLFSHDMELLANNQKRYTTLIRQPSL